MTGLGAGEATERTQERVRLALEDAVEEDPKLADELDAAVREIQTAQGRTATAAGDHGTAVAGNVDIHAETGGVAAWQTGDITLGGASPDPH